MPSFIVLACLEGPEVAKPGQTDRRTDRKTDRQNLRSLYITWLIPNAITKPIRKTYIN